MHKILSTEDVYDDLMTKGLYEEAHFDINEINKVWLMLEEDFAFAQQLKTNPKPSWRVIFNAYYSERHK